MEALVVQMRLFGSGLPEGLAPPPRIPGRSAQGEGGCADAYDAAGQQGRPAGDGQTGSPLPFFRARLCSAVRDKELAPKGRGRP